MGRYRVSGIRLSKAILMGVVLVSALSSQSLTYYVDALGGNDANTGFNERSAWQTLAKVNATEFQPGDSVLFMAQGVWEGQLYPKGSGSRNEVITIGSYGRGPRPKIVGDGSIAAVLLKNQDCWVISDLEVTNDAPDEGLRRGVLIQAENAGRVLSHIYLRNLDVHNVKGQLGAGPASRTTGGIAFEIRGEDRPTRFDDIAVEKCVVTHVDNCGIFTWTDFRTHPRDPRWQELRFTNVRIRNNVLTDIGKNAIVIRATLSPLIENNLVINAAARLHGNAIYVYGCKDALVQSNEVYGTKFTEVEGAAFDSDYNSEGTIIQYNYSHDNEGGLVNLCNNPKIAPPRGYNDGTIVRYNISQNDVYRVIAFDGPVTNTQIYNNTIYIGPNMAPKIVEFDLFGKSGGYASGATFCNNIFYNVGNGTYSWGGSSNVVFENNCFFGNHPESEPADGRKITSDPLLVSPGNAGTGRNAVGGYMLLPASPCINTGMPIDNNGHRDFWGRKVGTGKPTLGALEY